MRVRLTSPEQSSAGAAVALGRLGVIRDASALPVKPATEPALPCHKAQRALCRLAFREVLAGRQNSGNPHAPEVWRKSVIRSTI